MMTGWLLLVEDWKLRFIPAAAPCWKGEVQAGPFVLGWQKAVPEPAEPEFTAEQLAELDADYNAWFKAKLSTRVQDFIASLRKRTHYCTCNEYPSFEKDCEPLSLAQQKLIWLVADELEAVSLPRPAVSEGTPRR